MVAIFRNALWGWFISRRAIAGLLAAERRHQLAPFARRKAAIGLNDGLAGEETADDGETRRRDMRRAHLILHEGGIGMGHPPPQRVEHRLGIDADLVLRMRIGTQSQRLDEV